MIQILQDPAVRWFSPVFDDAFYKRCDGAAHRGHERRFIDDSRADIGGGVLQAAGSSHCGVDLYDNLLFELCEVALILKKA